MEETAEAFRTSWDKVFDAVEHVVTFGLELRTPGQIDAMGVDEIQYAKGHKCLTLVYQIDLEVTRVLGRKERTIESFQEFFAMIGDEVTSKIVFVFCDMWDLCLKVIREKCSENRAAWLWRSDAGLKREEDLKTEQLFRLRHLLRYNLRNIRAYLLKEAMQQLRDSNSATGAGSSLQDN